MLSNAARGLAEWLRPWAEMGACMIVVVLVCLLAGVDTASSPEYQDGLIAAAKGGDIRQIDRATKSGTSLEIRDSNGLTPLMIAARDGHLDAVMRLIARGANVNAFSEEFGTALTLAMQNERTDVVDVLLEHGAKETSQDKHFSLKL